jgi:hypothetical protein
MERCQIMEFQEVARNPDRDMRTSETVSVRGKRCNLLISSIFCRYVKKRSAHACRVPLGGTIVTRK